MFDAPQAKPQGFVVQFDGGAPYWRPVPTSSYAANEATPANWDDQFSRGVQAAASRGCIHVGDLAEILSAIETQRTL